MTLDWGEIIHETRKESIADIFEEILNGNKTNEVRLADWECKAGDVLVLKEWNPSANNFTGRTLEKLVTYVGKTKEIDLWPKEDVEKFGYQIISFK